MAIGFPYPRYRASRTFDARPEALTGAIEAAFDRLGWPYKHLWDHDFEARVPTTGWSWHHDVRVIVQPGGTVQAESKSAYQEMFIDLGRNKRIVERLFAQIAQSLQVSAVR